MPEHSTLRDDATAIWRAGVAAVDPRRLIAEVIQVSGDQLTIADHKLLWSELGTIAVVGAGKAGAGMVLGLEAVIPKKRHTQLSGWVNVPEDCVEPTQRIHLHGGRPPGRNEPTLESVRGTQAILQIVGQLNDNDVCLMLISGGGSALLCDPEQGVDLSDLQTVTRVLAARGASIAELNVVRQNLSRVKGGRFAEAVRAGRLITLVISDIIGDPPELIASGPTVPTEIRPADALEILDRFDPAGDGIPMAIRQFLKNAPVRPVEGRTMPELNAVHLIGRNEVAVVAARVEAEKRGYEVRELGSDNAGEARQVGVDLVRTARKIRDAGEADRKPICLLSGGEPVVNLAPNVPDRKGGRNQELVLGAVVDSLTAGLDRIAILSGGTDGEDGPTDAAGAVADRDLLRQAHRSGVDPHGHLARNDAYPFFERAEGLFKTGATGTNVMDLRVVLIGEPKPA